MLYNMLYHSSMTKFTLIIQALCAQRDQVAAQTFLENMFPKTSQWSDEVKHYVIGLPTSLLT